MIQEIAPMKYYNHYEEQSPSPDDWLLIYHDGELLCSFEKDLSFPKVSEIQQENMEITYLLTIDRERFFLLRDDRDSDLQGYGWQKLSTLRNAHPKYRVFAAETGMQLADWYRSNRYCGRCGKRMTPDHKERMMHCPDCGYMAYPKICPGVIVAVTDGDRLLLTKYAPGPGRTASYALIAGFTEIGETLEETVQREVMEEVGLKVKNIRYYKNQPWSFTSTLLCGFFCEVDGDTSIRLDTEELSVGEWFRRDEIPVDDDGISLTREMIGVFKAGGPHFQ
ncbi:MAG: NAD(+) diphosphatase [Lachnospiraceae bacterium]|nr:NAD(+) diphosphatase [Lachnospiraceae bacterium]